MGKNLVISFVLFIVVAELAITSAGKDYYQILGISRDANLKQIKKVWEFVLSIKKMNSIFNHIRHTVRLH